MLASQDVSRPQDALLRCRAISILRTCGNDIGWLSIPGLFLQGKRRVWSVAPLANTIEQEKRSGNDNNLSCIVVLPTQRRMGYGRFIIDFSKCGTGDARLTLQT